MQYHVFCHESGSRKMVSVDSKLDLVREIKKKFGIGHEILLQRPYENDWLDVEDDNEIPDGGRIQFIRNGNGLAHVAVVSHVGESPASTTPSRNTDLNNYRLPQFPADLVDDLKNNNGQLIINERRNRARIVQVIFDDLRATVGHYPEATDMKLVCSALVVTHPCLEDKIKIGQNGLRYHTWYESLKQKFKDNRRTLTSDEKVLQMKQKYGHLAQLNRRTASDAVLESTPRAKRMRLKFDDNLEDEHTLEEHLQTLKAQWELGDGADRSLISSRMKLTYQARRALIEGGEKLSVILASYPPLLDKDELKKEFLRMTDCQYRECLEKFWTESRVDIAVRKLSADPVCQKYLGPALGTNILDDKRDCLFRVIPRFFKEKLGNWMLTVSMGDDEEIIRGQLSPYPCAVLYAERSTEVEKLEKIEIYFERTRMCSCVSITEAACFIVMAYYVFNVKYPSELGSLFNFLDVYIGKIDKVTKLKVAVQRKLNLLLA